MRAIIMGIVILSSAGCFHRTVGTSLSDADQQVIRSVAFHHFAPERYRSGIAFLWIRGLDPCPETLAALSTPRTRVLPGSHHRIGQQPDRFEILSIRYELDSSVIVDARDFRDGFFEIRYRFALKRSPGGWAVVDAYRIDI
jgi:hypothetical protein